MIRRLPQHGRMIALGTNIITSPRGKAITKVTQPPFRLFISFAPHVEFISLSLPQKLSICLYDFVGAGHTCRLFQALASLVASEGVPAIMPLKRPAPEAKEYATRSKSRQKVEKYVSTRLEEALNAGRAKWVAIDRADRERPPPPDPVPRPAYDNSPETVGHSKPACEQFLVASANGDQSVCRGFVEGNLPSQATLAHGLEEASHSFQISIVNYLLQHTPLHFRCFRRCADHPNDLDLCLVAPTSRFPERATKSTSLSIFTSDHEDLFALLEVFLKHGWHPNQLLGPLQRPREGYLQWGYSVQEVALHYPRCIADVAILKLLLEAGADPTIAREKSRLIYPDGTEPLVHRASGFILDKAINVGTPETVDLLLAHGAKIELGLSLYTLARPYNAKGSQCYLSELGSKQAPPIPWNEDLPVAHQLPESPYPTPPLHVRLASHGISSDIQGCRDSSQHQYVSDPYAGDLY